jgi:hypothetical protein
MRTLSHTHMCMHAFFRGACIYTFIPWHSSNNRVEDTPGRCFSRKVALFRLEVCVTFAARSPGKKSTVETLTIGTHTSHPSKVLQLEEMLTLVNTILLL